MPNHRTHLQNARNVKQTFDSFKSKKKVHYCSWYQHVQLLDIEMRFRPWDIKHVMHTRNDACFQRLKRYWDNLTNKHIWVGAIIWYSTIPWYTFPLEHYKCPVTTMYMFIICTTEIGYAYSRATYNLKISPPDFLSESLYHPTKNLLTMSQSENETVLGVNNVTISKYGSSFSDKKYQKSSESRTANLRFKHTENFHLWR